MAARTSHLQELAAAAHAAESFQLRTNFDLPDGRFLEVRISGRPGGGRWDGVLNLTRSDADGDRVDTDVREIRAVDKGMRKVVERYPKAVLRADSIEVASRKGPLTAAKIKPVAVQGWCEAYGLPVPTLDELAERRKAAKVGRLAAEGETLALLKSGPSGVKTFNRRHSSERSKLDLTKADLAGCDLSSLKLCPGTKLTEARLAGARLTKALLEGCKLAGADLARADLTGADLRRAICTGASFAGADLTDAEFFYANIQGADFTGATLASAGLILATFDEHTKWPKGFKPPATLNWKGAGADPRQAATAREKSRPKPTDVAGFLKRLEKVADKSKLDKAMAMLKADRFRLFAKVEADFLVGVVKSQSDPTLVYSCRVDGEGKYACCTQNLNICGGLRGSPCKHLLVLIVGLTQAGELDPGTALDWTLASKGRKAELDRDAMAETFLQYKGAEAGEVDWRPTETIPEDFYAM